MFSVNVIRRSRTFETKRVSAHQLILLSETVTSALQTPVILLSCNNTDVSPCCRVLTIRASFRAMYISCCRLTIRASRAWSVDLLLSPLQPLVLLRIWDTYCFSSTIVPCLTDLSRYAERGRSIQNLILLRFSRMQSYYTSSWSGTQFILPNSQKPFYFHLNHHILAPKPTPRTPGPSIHNLKIKN